MFRDEPCGVLVETPAFLEDAARPGGGVLVPVTFAYATSDPWAVSMLLHTPTVVVPWTFARDLIADGLNQPTGEGDVTVTPTTGGIQVDLSSPSGSARLQFGRSPLEKLLEQTELLVPLGAESAHIDWDYALATLVPGGER